MQRDNGQAALGSQALASRCHGMSHNEMCPTRHGLGTPAGPGAVSPGSGMSSACRNGGHGQLLVVCSNFPALEQRCFW